MNGLGIIFFIAFIIMSGFSIYINWSWSKKYEELNNSWFNICNWINNSYRDITLPERLRELRRNILEQKETGVIVLPSCVDAVVVPDDIKIVIDDEREER